MLSIWGQVQGGIQHWKTVLCHFPPSQGKGDYRITNYNFGLPWWLSGKEPTCQCRRRGFDPWVGKIPWRRKWQPTPVFLPGESPGQRSLVCWTHKRVGHSLTTTLYTYSTPSNPTQGVHPTEMNAYSHRKVYKNVYNRFIPNSPKAVK